MLDYGAGNPRVANFWDSSLFRKENGKYYEAIPPDRLAFPITNSNPGIYEFVFMEDNAPVGTSWSNTITGTFTFSNGSMIMDQTYEAHMTEYFPSFKTDSSHTFLDVVQITTNMKSVGYGSNNQVMFQTSEVYDKWYARNVGLIKTIQYSYPYALKVSRYHVF
jgi:hypothetical protein